MTYAYNFSYKCYKCQFTMNVGCEWSGEIVFSLIRCLDFSYGYGENFVVNVTLSAPTMHDSILIGSSNAGSRQCKN